MQDLHILLPVFAGLKHLQQHETKGRSVIILLVALLT